MAAELSARASVTFDTIKLANRTVLGVTRQPVEPWVDGFVETIIKGIGAQE
jgi:hypothetical protein